MQGEHSDWDDYRRAMVADQRVVLRLPISGYTAWRAAEMALRIGYKASAEQFAPRQLLDYAVQAEAVGLDSVTISDHFQPWQHDGGHAPFALVLAGRGR